MTTPDPDTDGARKVCAGCTSKLTLGSFHRDASQPDGLATRCRECVRLGYRRNRDTARLRDSRNHQRRKASMWRDRYAALLAALPDDVLDGLPEELRPTLHSRRLHRAARRRET